MLMVFLWRNGWGIDAYRMTVAHQASYLVGFLLSISWSLYPNIRGQETGV